MASDEWLHEQIRRGDMASFDVLYRRYEKRLFQFIYSYLRDQCEAEDIFHESMMEVLRSKDVDFVQSTFCTWVYRIARNKSLNHLRSQKRRDGAFEAAPVESIAGQQPELADALILEKEKFIRLDQIVASLPESLAEVYQLRKHELSYEQMACVLGIPEGTVKSRLHELVNRLKEGMRLWNAEQLTRI